MIFSVMFHYMWEAMLVSYLAATIIVLPFDSIQTLMSQSDFKVAVQPGTYQQSVFEDSLDPIWQAAWKERAEPYMDLYKSYYSESYKHIAGKNPEEKDSGKNLEEKYRKKISRKKMLKKVLG